MSKKKKRAQRAHQMAWYGGEGKLIRLQPKAKYSARVGLLNEIIAQIAEGLNRWDLYPPNSKFLTWFPDGEPEYDPDLKRLIQEEGEVWCESSGDYSTYFMVWETSERQTLKMLRPYHDKLKKALLKAKKNNDELPSYAEVVRYARSVTKGIKNARR